MLKKLLEMFQPEQYNLTLDINREAMTFSGNVEITGQLLQPTNSIDLHAKDLTIVSATINGLPASRISAEKFDVLRLTSDKEIIPGTHTVSVEFEGKITDAMQGIYPSNFEHEGKQKKLISTQFESHHAREAFPCIDEPAAKAIFDLTLLTPAGEPVLANTDILEQSTHGDRLKTTFETTPKMSTYLLAFVFGEMHCQEARTADGILVRSWASVAQPKSWLTYSLHEGVRLLEFFSEYFDTPFPLKKCDQIALPDFDAGAMENWGLVTYRETVLLADPHNRSISTEQYVSLVVAHELSHQWFGNLVTMQWWDDLWLNESFASLMEYLALDALHPDWHEWEEYTASDVIATSSRDCFKDVQPVYTEVLDPELIEALFDPAIVYAKGGRLLKMLREYIGDQAFRDGLKSYFKTYAYKNTTRNDLWEAFENASGQDIKKLMDPWLRQSGMPLLSVTQTGNKLHIEQERFVLDTKSDRTIWPIPLLADHVVTPTILEEKTDDIETENDEFIMVNQYGSGHYVTHYTEVKHQEALADKLQKQTISAEGRITLLNDMMLLARRGDSSIATALQLAIACQNEKRSAVWDMMTNIFASARLLVEGDSETEGQLKDRLAHLSRPLYKELGWDDNASDDPNQTHLRTIMISNLLAAKDQEAIKSALELYDTHKDSLQKLPGDLRTAILIAAVRHGEESVVTHLLDEYHSTQAADLQFDISVALTATERSEDAQRYFSEALGKDDFVRTQDFPRWLIRLLNNQFTRGISWAWMEENWDEIYERLSTMKSFDYMPLYIAKSLTTQKQLEQYKAFFEPKKDIAILQKNIEIGTNEIIARIAWRNRDEPKIKNWHKDN